MDALKPYYLESTSTCLQDIFEEWLAYKRTITDSPNTICAHRKHWKRFFDGTDFFQIPLQEIKVSDINSWANQLIKKYNLSSHTWQTIKTIPKQMFEYAKDHRYIATNPFPELKVTVKFRQVSKPTSETQVYNTDEYHKIIEDLWKSYDKKHEPRHRLQFPDGITCRRIVRPPLARSEHGQVGNIDCTGNGTYGCH